MQYYNNAIYFQMQITVEHISFNDCYMNSKYYRVTRLKKMVQGNCSFLFLYSRTQKKHL